MFIWFIFFKADFSREGCDGTDPRNSPRTYEKRDPSETDTDPVTFM